MSPGDEAAALRSLWASQQQADDLIATAEDSVVQIASDTEAAIVDLLTGRGQDALSLADLMPQIDALLRIERGAVCIALERMHRQVLDSMQRVAAGSHRSGSCAG